MLRQARGRDGGRSWWAHLAFTRMNIELTIGKKEIEESLLNRAKDATTADLPWLS
jgi:hypothetical protein